jgi:hypothetical protein
MRVFFTTALRLAATAILLLLLPVAALAQPDAHHMNAPKPAGPPSQAQAAFDMLKTFAGEWEGPVKANLPPEMRPKGGDDMKPMHVTMRVTSRGNTITHEFQEAGTLLDAAKYDHPVTMFYVDASTLNLVHYCDAGNRPHMIGKISPDGKTVEFDFSDLSGSNQHGHMHHAVFTMVDADHHIEDWTFMAPNDTPILAHFDLHRVSGSIAGAGTK